MKRLLERSIYIIVGTLVLLHLLPSHDTSKSPPHTGRYIHTHHTILYIETVQDKVSLVVGASFSLAECFPRREEERRGVRFYTQFLNANKIFLTTANMMSN